MRVAERRLAEHCLVALRQGDTLAAYLLAYLAVVRSLEESLQEVLVGMRALILGQAPGLGLVCGWLPTVVVAESVYLGSVSSPEELLESYV